MFLYTSVEPFVFYSITVPNVLTYPVAKSISLFFQVINLIKENLLQLSFFFFSRYHGQTNFSKELERNKILPQATTLSSCIKIH
jgi:hypothetical protein